MEVVDEQLLSSALRVEDLMARQHVWEGSMDAAEEACAEVCNRLVQQLGRGFSAYVLRKFNPPQRDGQSPISNQLKSI
jgi:hypothetical protein